MNNNKQRGFTLVELMVVVALMALLVLSVAPLTGAWVQDADITEVEGEITQAIGRAKAQALRNFPAAIADDPVTAICISNTKLLTVLEGTSAALPNCGTNTGTQLWSTQLDTDITITVADQALSCMCFNNKGMITTTQCSGCASATTLKLSASATKYETVEVY